MPTINESLQKVKSLKKDFKQALSPEGEILGLHESASKLWLAIMNKKASNDEIGKRLASALIGLFSISVSLGINDLETCLKKRMDYLEEVAE